MMQGISTTAKGWSWKGLLIVLLVTAAVLGPGTTSLPVIDRDEARFAQASRQMLESTTLEGWIVPRVAEQPRLNKPPLIYWLQSSSAWVATAGDASQDAIWMYRLPSLLAALLTAGLVWRIGCRMFDSTTGVVAGILIGTCPLVVFDAHMARADEVLLALTLAAQGSLWWCWRERDRTGGPSFGATALFWVFVGLGTLTKGPITPFVCGTTAIALAGIDRQWKWLWHLRPWLGVFIVGGIVGPWVVAIINTMGWETIRTFFDEEVVRRAASGVEGHSGPPGYHLVLMTLLFWPGSLLATAAFIFAVRRVWQRRSEHDAEFFLLAWLVPSWIAFELAGTKLPHYVLPLYPALAILLARGFVLGVTELPNTRGILAEIGFGIWVVLGLVLAALPLGLLFAVETTPSTTAVVIAGVACLATLMLITVAYISLRQGNVLRTLSWAVAAVVLSQVTVLGVVLPGLEDIWISPRLMALIEEDSSRVPAEEAFPPFASQGFGEDSLVFLSRGKVKMVADAAAFLEVNPGAYAVVPTVEAKAIADRTNALSVGSVRGFDYSDGEVYDLTVLRAGTE